MKLYVTKNAIKMTFEVKMEDQVSGLPQFVLLEVGISDTAVHIQCI